jgi:hypothetical protein
MDSERVFADLDALIGEASPPERPALVVGLCARLAALGAVLAQAPPAPAADTPDRNLDVPEIAKRLGMSERYVYRNRKRLPFIQTEGRRVVGSERGLSSYLAQQGKA